MPRALAAALAASTAAAFAPSQNPPWGPHNYNMSLSTLSMRWNSSGWSPVALDATFGVVSYDWSNNKAAWAAAKPMSDWELLLQQAADTRAANPATRVFLYANLVKVRQGTRGGGGGARQPAARLRRRGGVR